MEYFSLQLDTTCVVANNVISAYVVPPTLEELGNSLFANGVVVPLNQLPIHVPH